ncbi:hypothetical protein H4R34_000724 [Dimargaris verticillata]|uniref:WD40-repeat-containing domain protein n=1 Tax=Dimargaris verticillata TaxID=2761393 RepID=A0A9W8B9V5_9FUNG|nr:hypothetical protein H4R34_000724 [Dimargaris verticillata]
MAGIRSTYELLDPVAGSGQVYCPDFQATEGIYRLKADLSYEAIVVDSNTAVPPITQALAPPKYLSLVSVRFRGAQTHHLHPQHNNSLQPNTGPSSYPNTDNLPRPTLPRDRLKATASSPLSQSLPPSLSANPTDSTASEPSPGQDPAIDYTQSFPPAHSAAPASNNASTLTGTSVPAPLAAPQLPRKDTGDDDDSSFSLFQSMRLKKRSKSSNLTKKDAAFVSQVIWHDNLAMLLAQRPNEGTYFFYNSGRSFFWADLGHAPQEPLGRLDFYKAIPICHDVNLLTRSGSSLDVIIGFSTGDLLWFDPITQKRTRYNAQGVINASAVTAVRWVPGSETHFMASFQDGAVVIFDKYKEDHQHFNPLFAMDPSDPLQVAKPTKSKYNPTTYWQVSKKPITALAFSPDCQHVAFTSMDGRLRVVDYVTETLEDTYVGYFGGLTCLSWSPDGKYILTGGQDDLITIWDFYNQRILARCQGHQSWVNGVTFDAWRCDETNYRFGSVGEDTKVLFWDFSVSALHRPKSAAIQLRRMSRASSTFSPPSATTPLYTQHENVVHEVTPQSQVADLEPVMAQSIHRLPVCSITFREDAVFTTCRSGHIKIWLRPDTAAS